MRLRNLACGFVLGTALATTPVVSSYADVEPAATAGSYSLTIPLEVAPSEDLEHQYRALLPDWFSPVMSAQIDYILKDHDTVAIETSSASDVEEETVVNIGTRTEDAAPKKAPEPPTPPAPAKIAKEAAPKVVARQPPSRQQRLTRNALTYRGLPYRWGGQSRQRGFDCSGLTQHLYRQEGLELPRTAREQYKVGKQVSIKELKQGDLVFFNTMGPLTHVGMYIGDGKFVHAANSRRGIVVNSLSDAYYKKHYEGARRYLP